MAQWYNDYQVWLTEGQSLHNAQMVADHFAGKGWTPESIAALCGNMRHESSINPDMYEYGYAWSEDRGYGLVQWTPRSKYWDWATARSLDPRAGDSQLARLDYEVENNIQWIPDADYNNMTFAEFRGNTGGWSVDYLTEAFTWSYERPNRTAGEDSMPDRQAFAQEAYTTLDFSASGGTSPALPVLEGTPITSPYGWRTDPIDGGQDFHAGTDYGGSSGDPIFATQTGIVLDVGFDSILGYYIDLEHTGDQYFSRYQHLLEQPSLSIGTTVSKGQQIGLMGTTGSSTGVHLHFVIATDDSGSWYTSSNTIDPEQYLEMTFGSGGDTDQDKKKTAILVNYRNTNMRRDGRRR